MESLLKRSLNNREKCFEIDSCPLWLSKILPNRIKTVELIVENVNEQVKIAIDLSPYQLNSSIPLLTDEFLVKEEDNDDEYPHDQSHQNQFLRNSSEYLLKPSNEQIYFLLKQLKQNQLNEKKNEEKEKKFHRCENAKCPKEKIPLTSYCLSHLYETDSRQILLVQCHSCQQISFKEDKKNLLHICS